MVVEGGREAIVHDLLAVVWGCPCRNEALLTIKNNIDNFMEIYYC